MLLEKNLTLLPEQSQNIHVFHSTFVPVTELRNCPQMLFSASDFQLHGCQHSDVSLVVQLASQGGSYHQIHYVKSCVSVM